jgi:hypothetical protein
MKTYGKVLNEINEYGVNILKCMECMFSLLNELLEDLQIYIRNKFVKIFLNTPLHNNIM